MRSMFILLATIGTIIGCDGGSGSNHEEEAAASPTGAVANTFVQIPTDVGKIWARVFYPEGVNEYRYGTAGPVAVYIDGSTTAWSLNGSGKTSLEDFEKVVREGFVVITWHLPGTTEMIEGKTYASDGTFDYRGEDSIAALRDVLKFAMGDLSSAEGHPLTSIAPGADSDNVGVIGFSNGGNLAWATLDQHGSELSQLAWYVGYETPIDNETRGVGRIHSDPNNSTDGRETGFTTDDGFNPHAGSWTEEEGWDFDTAKLVYNTTSGKTMKFKFADGTALTLPGMIFFDGNGNNYPDQIAGSCDINGNGKFDTTEDFTIGGNPVEIAGEKKVVLPIRVREAMPNLPSQVATVTETIEYWSKREMAASIPVAAAQNPNLETILFYSKLDHDLPFFPGSPHAHIYAGYALHMDNGLWVRLNPARSYVKDLFSKEGVTIPETYAENEPNLPKSTVREVMHDLAAPDATNHYWLYLTASMNELADRKKNQ